MVQIYYVFSLTRRIKLSRGEWRRANSGGWYVLCIREDNTVQLWDYHLQQRHVEIPNFTTFSNHYGGKLWLGGRWQTVTAIYGGKTDTLETQTLLHKLVCVLKVNPWEGTRAAPPHLKPQTLTAFAIKAFFFHVFFFFFSTEPLMLQSSPPSWGNAFWFVSRACREGLGEEEEKKTMKKYWKESKCC